MSGDKPWDQPWTLQQMRDNAANWSLAGDAGMLNYLVQFSQDVIERAQTTTATLDGMIADLDQTQSELSNVCNEFNLLAHSQFVENRVAEEDVETKAAPSSASAEQPVLSPEERVQEVLKNSLSFLDEMFETVEVPVGSDSEEEEDSSPANSRRTQVILKPVNPYSERRLPHIIGTKEFEADDNVGLVLTPSDDEETEESPLAELHLARAQISESSSEAEVGANFSLPSDGEDDEIFSPKPPPLPQSQSQSLSQSLSFADELASKLGVTPVVSTQQQQQQPKQSLPAKQPSQTFPPVDQREPPGLFGGDEEEAEDDDWIFGPSKGTFSGGKGLFDDTPEDTIKPAAVKPPVAPVLEEEDDEDNIFSAAVKPPPVKQSTVNVNKPAANQIKDLFDDEETEDDLFAKPQPSGKRKSSTLLFSDEEDLFAAPSRLHPGHPPNLEPKIPQRVQSSPKVMPRTTQGSPDLFSEPDLQPKDHGSPKAMPRSQGSPKVAPRSPKVTPRSREESPKPEDTPTTKKLPAGAVSMFGGKSIFPATALRRQASSSSEDSVEPPSVVKPQPSVAKSQDTSGVKPTPRQEVPKPAARTVEPEAKPKPASNKKTSLFDDNDSEEDLFSTVKVPSKPKTSEPTKTTTQKVSLFGDSDEDEFIPKSQKPTKTNIFNENESSKPLFDEIENKTPIKSNEQPKRKSSKSKNTIFNDSESEDDVIFSSASSGSSKSSKLFENAPKTTTSTASRHGLFDDDWLFNATPKTDSSSLFGESEDLFSSSKPEKRSSDVLAKSEKTSEPTKSEKKVSVPDDLFTKESTKADELFTSAKSENKSVESDLFATKNISKPHEESDDLFANAKPSKSDLYPTDKSKDLFSETKQEKKTDDIFSEKSAKEPKNTTKSDNISKKSDLFSPAIGSDDLFTTAKTEDKPKESDLFSSGIGSDDLFATTKPDSKLKESDPFSIGIDSDDLFSNDKKSISETQPIKKIVEKTEEPITDNTLKTQASNDSDDLFAEKITKNIPSQEANKTPVLKEAQKKGISLFDSEEEDIFAPKTKKTETKEEISHKDELFSSENTISNKTNISESKVEENKDLFSGNNDLFSGSTKTDLFSTEPQEDLFADAVSSPMIEDDLFSSNKATPKLVEKPEVTLIEETAKVSDTTDSVKPQVPVKKEPPKSLDVPKAASLFSAVEDNAEDLFSASPSSQQTEKPSVTPRQSSALKPPSEPIAAKISPVQRGMGLNINPLALLPGQRVKPYKQSVSKEEPSETDKPEVVPRSTEPVPEVEPKSKVTEKPEITPRSSESSVKKPEVLPRNIEKPEVNPSEVPPELKSTSEVIEKPPEVKPRPVLKPLNITSQVLPEVVTSVTSPVEAAISFDDPTSGTNLNFPNKDRIKIPHKRKASTRRGRGPSSQNEPSPITPKTEPITPTEKPIVKSNPITPSSYMAPPLLDREPPPLPPSNPMSPSTDEEDVFDLPSEYLDDEDMLFKPVPSLSFDQPKPSINLFPDQALSSPDESLFSNNDNLFAPNTDIFTTPTENAEDLFSTPTKIPETTDKLFSNDNLFPETSKNDKLFSGTSGSDNLFPEATKNDNLFPETSKTDKLFPETSSNDNLFPEASKNDNLFPEASKNDKLFPKTSESDNLFPEASKDDNLFPETSKNDHSFETTSSGDKLFNNSNLSATNLFSGEVSDISTNLSSDKLSDNVFETTTDDKVIFESIDDKSSSNIFPEDETTTDIFDTSVKSTNLFSESTEKNRLESTDVFDTSSKSKQNILPSSDNSLSKKSPEVIPETPDSRKSDDIFSKDILRDNIEGEEDDLFSSPKAEAPSKVLPTKQSSTSIKPTASKVVEDIFDEGDDEDIFSSPVQATAAVKPKSQPPPKSQPIAKPPVVKTASKGLFGDSDDEDLFATAAKSTPKSTPSVSKSTPKTKTTPKPVTKTVKKEDDFEDPLMAFQQD